MASIESNPGTVLDTVAELPVWDSYVVVSPLNATRPTDEQLNVFYDALKGHLKTEQTTTTAKDQLIDAKVEISGTLYSLWGFALELAAPNDTVAVQSSMALVTESLDRAHIDASDLELVDLHLANLKVLMGEQKLRTELADGRKKVSISDADFTARADLRNKARALLNNHHAGQATSHAA